MSTRAEAQIPTLEDRLFGVALEKETMDAAETASWDPERFADEQIRSLVRRVFVPGWPRPSRQVVLSAVAQGTDIEPLSLQIARMLAEQAQGSVCIVETSARRWQLETSYGRTPTGPASPPEKPDTARKSSRQICDYVWQMPLAEFPGEQPAGLSPAWLSERLGRLRRDFDYTLVQAPPAEMSGEAALLGHVSDGIILVLQAHMTHRLAAQKARNALQSSNARLLGAVLIERTFPIPKSLYRRL